MRTTLYKVNKNGSKQQWSISTNEDTYTVEHGLVGGKLQTKITTVTGKNLCKANEVSPSEQAIREKDALITRQLKKGYSYSIEADSEVKLPMRVKVLQDNWNNVLYPCVSTVKLNGINGTYKLIDNKLRLYSRGGEEYPRIPHLEPSVLKLMDFLGSKELNGELYIHSKEDGTRYHLQELSSLVKKSKPESSNLKFFVFDIADSTDTYKNRRELLKKYNVFASISVEVEECVLPIIGTICTCASDIEDMYDIAMEDGYEGTVIKNLDGLYKHNIRSSNQFKYKKTLDCEKQVVAYKLDKNGHCVFTVLVDHTLPVSKDNTFNVKLRGSSEKRLEMAKNADKYIGKWLNLDYECLTVLGKCSKPVGNYFRDMKDGEPNE